MPNLGLKLPSPEEIDKELARRGLGAQVEVEDFGQPPQWFHEGQMAAWVSRAVDIAVIAGFQSGKTAEEPYWLLRELQRCAPFILWLGYGRAIFAGPTLTLMGEQAIPAFKLVFEENNQLGTFISGNKPFFRFSATGAARLLGFSAPLTVRFEFTNDSSNLESVTACCGVWDEAGQKENKQESYEAYNRRLEIARSTTFGAMADWIREDPNRTKTLQWWLDSYFEEEGREATFGHRFWGTTPYEWNWFKTSVHDRAERGEDGFALFNFPTWLNPKNSKVRCLAAKGRMPEWQWLMMYTGVYTKPAGAIYDCFENRPDLFKKLSETDPTKTSETNVCKRFAIPADWPVTIGIDFGNNNTAAILSAAEIEDGKPTNRHFAFGSYKKAGRTNEEHAWAIRATASGLAAQFLEAFEAWSLSPERTYREEGSPPPKVIQSVLARCTVRAIAYGGSHTEQGWRDAFQLGGLKVYEPLTGDVELGISCGYTGIKERRFIFFDDLAEVVSDMERYARELDTDLEPTEKIKQKAKWHFPDSYRYLATKLFPPILITPVRETRSIKPNATFNAEYAGVKQGRPWFQRSQTDEDDD